MLFFISSPIKKRRLGVRRPEPQGSGRATFFAMSAVFEAPVCYLCQEPMYPAHLVAASWCRPVPHYTHALCSLSRPPTTDLRCGICRSRGVTNTEIFVLREGLGLLLDDDDESMGSAYEDYPELGQKMLNLLMDDKLTEEDMEEWFAAQRITRMLERTNPRPMTDTLPPVGPSGRMWPFRMCGRRSCRCMDGSGRGCEP